MIVQTATFWLQKQFPCLILCYCLQIQCRNFSYSRKRNYVLSLNIRNFPHTRRTLRSFPWGVKQLTLPGRVHAISIKQHIYFCLHLNAVVVCPTCKIMWERRIPVVRHRAHSWTINHKFKMTCESVRSLAQFTGDATCSVCRVATEQSASDLPPYGRIKVIYTSG